MGVGALGNNGGNDHEVITRNKRCAFFLAINTAAREPCMQTMFKSKPGNGREKKALLVPDVIALSTCRLLALATIIGVAPSVQLLVASPARSPPRSLQDVPSAPEAIHCLDQANCRPCSTVQDGLHRSG